MDVFSTAKLLGALILPPMADDSERCQFWNHFLLRVAAYGALLLALGGGYVGLTHFASKEDVSVISHDLSLSRAEQDKDSILTLRATECGLPTGASKALYTATITTRMDEYFALTGSGFQLPNCTDF